jgi:hypothetical protein
LIVSRHLDVQRSPLPIFARSWYRGRLALLFEQRPDPAFFAHQADAEGRAPAWPLTTIVTSSLRETGTCGPSSRNHFVITIHDVCESSRLRI